MRLRIYLEGIHSDEFWGRLGILFIYFFFQFKFPFRLTWTFFVIFYSHLNLSKNYFGFLYHARAKTAAEMLRVSISCSDNMTEVATTILYAGGNLMIKLCRHLNFLKYFFSGWG